MCLDTNEALTWRANYEYGLTDLNDIMCLTRAGTWATPECKES